MKAIILFEGLLFVLCFVGATAIATMTKDIKRASLLLYGFLLVWFIVFFLAIPGIRVFVLGNEAAATSFADSPLPILFMIIAAIYCLLFACCCIGMRWLWRRLITKRQKA